MSPDSTRDEYERVKLVKEAYEKDLLTRQNVVGCGVGYKLVDGERTNILSIVVMVSEKVSENVLALKEIIPKEVDGVPVDVQEVGELRTDETHNYLSS